jgi:acyl carrier protein
MTQSPASIEEHVKELIAENYAIPLAQVENTSELNDFGDSLDLVELVLTLEDEYDIWVDDEFAERQSVTVQDCIDLVVEKI